MATPKVKLFAITTVIFSLLFIVFFALSVTSIGKYKGQKTRVEHLEQKILAGKKEMLKVPEVIGKLRVADKAILDLDSQVADLTESNEELTGEVAELTKENTILTVAKLVLETDKAGYTKNIVEARQALEELRERTSTNDGGVSFYEEDKHIETGSGSTESHEVIDIEDVHVPLAEQSGAGLQSTLNSIRNTIQSSHFMYSEPAKRSEMLNSLISKAENHSDSSSEIQQLVREIAEKVASEDTTMSEIFDLSDKL